MTLTPLNDADARIRRIDYPYPKYDPDPDTMPDDQKPQRGPDEDEDDYEERIWEWAEDFRREHVVQPEPGIFKFPEKVANEAKAEDIDLERDYGHRGLQVIVKLATIYLTPEKPSYDGGSWHVEGQLVGSIHIFTSVSFASGANISRMSTSARPLCTITTVKISRKVV